MKIGLERKTNAPSGVIAVYYDEPGTPNTLVSNFNSIMLSMTNIGGHLPDKLIIPCALASMNAIQRLYEIHRHLMMGKKL